MRRCCAQGYPQPVDDVDSSPGAPGGDFTDVPAESIHSFPQPPIHIHPQITPLIHSFLWMLFVERGETAGGDFCGSMPESGVH